MKILVTGGTGMLGHALRKHLPDARYMGYTRGDQCCDLSNRHEADDVVGGNDVVIHCAARVGGIKDNNDKPYDYFTENALINTNVVDACVRFKVPKLIAISSTCVYPADPPSFPITEEMLHLGPPHETNFGYAYAKRMMQVQIDAARKQFGFKWSVVYPSNLYGPHDTFDLQRSHVVPALMMKMHAAKEIGADTVELWGTGKATRQLTYVNDLARLLFAMSQSDVHGDFNFAWPIGQTIEQIAELTALIVGFKGKIVFDGRLDGVLCKDVSDAKLCDAFGIISLGLDMVTTFEGIKQTYEWYLANGAPK